jgi:predicted ATP-grasp superfamily ATP-dependent carboligase
VIAPPADAEQAVADLEALGSSYRRPVLFYASDEMLQLISRHRERLERHFVFRMPPPDLVEDLLDKSRFALLAERAGLPVPRTLPCTRATTAAEALAAVGLPCVYKPSTHIGWLRSGVSRDGKPRKALIARDPQELVALHERVKNYATTFLVQRYVAGGEDRIYSYHAYLGQHGTPLGEFAGKKLRTYPKEAGISTCLELVKEPRLLELGGRICRTLGLVGAVKIDFKRDPTDGRFHLLEINPRFTLWSYLGATCGVNLPLIAYADLVGASAPWQAEYRTGVRWLSFGNDCRAFVRDYLPSGELSLSDWLRSFLAPTVYDVFSWSDPVPLGASMANWGKARLERMLRDLAGQRA